MPSNQVAFIVEGHYTCIDRYFDECMPWSYDRARQRDSELEGWLVSNFRFLGANRDYGVVEGLIVSQQHPSLVFGDMETKLH